MKQISPLLAIALIGSIICTHSCKKDDEPVPPTLEDVVLEKETTLPSKQGAEDYFPLNEGNCWIYDVVIVDTNDQDVRYLGRDTVVVVGDTLINGYTYAVLNGSFNERGGPTRYSEYLRDSVGYLVNHHGKISFSMSNFSDTLLKTDVRNADSTLIFASASFMNKVKPEVKTLAGTFKDVIDFERKFRLGKSLARYQGHHSRSGHTYYAKGVGKIFNSYFFISSPNITERRLAAYSLVP